MSIEVRIPKEITEYKEKILFGLSIRQLICSTIAIVIGTGTYLLLLKLVNADIASYVVIFEVLPLFALGFFRKNGFTLEKYAAIILKHKLGTKRRVYKTELLIDDIPDAKPEKKKRGVKNVWLVSIYKKWQQAKAAKNIRECTVFKVTAQSRKRKIQEARREIEAARKEYRRAKQAAEKAAKK